MIRAQVAWATFRYWVDMFCARILDLLDTEPARFGPTVTGLDYIAEEEAWSRAQRRFVSDDSVIAELERQFQGEWS